MFNEFDGPASLAVAFRRAPDGHRAHSLIETVEKFHYVRRSEVAISVARTEADVRERCDVYFAHHPGAYRWRVVQPIPVRTGDFMPAQIRPTRLEVSDRFPILGFSIRAEGPPKQAEVAIGSEPELFGIEGKTRRTSSNFYSTRATGPLPIARGEAVFIVPPEVLARFVGHDKLYFGLATAGDEEPKGMQVAVTPTGASAYVSLRGLTERSLQRIRVLPRRRARGDGYGDDAKGALEWAGDDAAPGMQAVRVNGANGANAANGANGANGASRTSGSTTNGFKADGTTPRAPAHVPYDDGFGPMPPKAAAPPPAIVLPPAPAAALDASEIAITGAQRPVAAPPVRRLESWESSLIRAGLATAAGPIGPLFGMLPMAATSAGVSIGVGPAVGAGLGAGGSLGAGIIFGPDGGIGVYGAAEIDIGFISSISATVQVTVVRGGIESFNGWSTAIAIAGGEGVVGGGAALFDTNANFQGASASVGVGAGFSPIDFYVAVQRGAASRLPVAQSRALGVRTNARALIIDADDVDNGKLAKDWIDLVRHGVQPAIVTALTARDMQIQALADAVGTFNFDRYDVRIDTPPTVNGMALDGPALVERLRLHLNDFVDTDTSSFAPYDAGVDDVTWGSASPAGAVFSIDFGGLPGVDNAAVVGSYVDSRRWLFTTVHAPRTGYHPVSGTREFGVRTDADGSLVAYTRGVDRATGILEDVGDRLVFSGQEALWQSFQRKLVEFVNANGGSATALSPVVKHMNWNVITIMYSVQSETLGSRAPRAGAPRAGRALSADQSFTLNWDEVESIPQPTDFSCWAAAAAMVIGWRDQRSLAPETIAEICGRSTRTGLYADDNRAFATEMGLVAAPAQSYTFDGLRDLVARNGPLWVSKGTVPNLHAVVVTGVYADGTGSFVRVTDPWDRVVGSPGTPGDYQTTHQTGSRYIMRWEDFAAEYEAAISGPTNVNAQILHSGTTNGRVANTGQSTPAGYAQSRGLSNESFTINWDEVELIAQPTNVSCWAAAGAMVVGWKELVSLTVDSVGQICHRTTATGLDPSAVQAFASEMGLTFEYPASYSVDGFRTLLANNGPLWVAADVPGLHAIVVTGLYSDGTDTFVRIADPWDRTVGTPGAPGAYLATHTTGSRYIMKWDDFVAEYERAAMSYASVNLQILHSGSIGTHTPNTGGSTPSGYAMSRAATTARPSNGRAPTRAAPGRTARTLEADQPRTLGSQDGIEWDLMQYPGMLRAGAASSSATPIDGERVTLSDWPYVEDTDGSRTQATITIGWKYDVSGAVGAVQVVPGEGRASTKRTLKIVATIQETDAGTPRAALQVSLRYVFRHPVDGEQVALTTITLRGDGTHTRSGDWTSTTRAAA